jgi:ATP-dependent RNA helicase DeaD
MGGTSLAAERRALARRPALVVGTPGRVLDHLKGGAFTSDGIEHVVLDESDRMLDMGFREELEAILELLPSERRTHLVSATFPSGVRRLADRFQDGALHIEGTRLGAANVDIEHVAHVLDRREAHAALVNHLLLNGEGRCLVFVERRVDAAELAATLSADGFAVHALSGELPQAQRTRTINAFRNGTVRTLVATDVAARGIDVPEIELVVQYDVPNDADTCVHRSGRTGRAGRTGRNVMFVPPRARSRLQRMLGAARIECTWTAAPSAARVQKELRKRFRHGIHERLRSSDAAPQQQLDFAKRLLDGRDPAEVVAVLLELAQRKPTCEPMEIRQTTAAPPPRRGGGDASQGFVRFTINWGASSGAATNRLLSHVCRRGAIRSNLIGTIELGEHESWFDVDASVADRFAKRASRPDRREPRLRISRLGPVGAVGAKPPARRKRKHVPPTGSRPHGRKARHRDRTPRRP